MAEAIVLALLQKEFVIDRMSITELSATIHYVNMSAPTLWYRGMGTKIGAGLSGDEENRLRVYKSSIFKNLILIKKSVSASCQLA